VFVAEGDSLQILVQQFIIASVHQNQHLDLATSSGSLKMGFISSSVS
jgi:hypothetical protein